MLSWLRRERGQDLVEYALILPVLLVLMFGIIQLALVILAYNTVGDAARQGARLGVIGDNANRAGDIAAEVYQVTDAAGMKRGDLIVNSVHQQDKIRVTVTYNMLLIFPIFGKPRITLQAVSTKLIELQ
jgi:Flp pilus assembly protein TadG